MDLTMLMNLTWLCECVWALHSSFSSHLKQLPASFSKEPCFLLGLYEPVCIRYFFLEFFFFFFNRQLFLPKKNFAYCHGNGLRILYFFSSFPMDCSYIPLFSLHLPDLLKFLPTYNISPYKFLLLSPTLKFQPHNIIFSFSPLTIILNVFVHLLKTQWTSQLLSFLSFSFTLIFFSLPLLSIPQMVIWTCSIQQNFLHLWSCFNSALSSLIMIS